MTASSPDARLPLGFKRHLRAEVVPGEATYLLSPQGVTAMEGRLVEVLAPLLDGTRSLDRILDEAGDAMSALDAGRVLGRLARANLVGYRRPSADEAAHAYWDMVGQDGAETALAATRVEVVTAGRVDAAAARAACRESGLAVPDPDDPAGSGDADFSLVLCDDYLNPELERINAERLAAGRPWLLASPGTAQPWVGPVFRPAEGACWSCLAHRLRGQRRSELPLQRARGLAGPLARPVASLPAGRAVGLHTAVLAAVKWLAGMRSPGDDAVLTLDTVRMESRHHQVVRRPQCPDCGDPALVAARVTAPVIPRQRAKAGSAGGGHRALDPAEMLRRHEHLVSPVSGVVEEIRRNTRLPEAVNCYHSGRNLAIRGDSLPGLRHGLRSLSGGKGTTELDARVGALCEAVERYSATRQGDEPTVQDTYRALGDRAVHPNDCQLFSARQFAERERWNTASSPFSHVPRPLEADRPVSWTPVWSLTSGRHRLLPTAMLYFGANAGHLADGLWADSNGNAAGSSLEDAIVQGFLELVERDAVALWWYNRTRQPAVDLDAFDEPCLARLREAYATMGRTFWVLDLTSDFGVPVMAAVSRRTDQPAEELAFGFGAHFDPRLALRRAVTEMGQLLPPSPGPGGTGYGLADRDLISWWTGATVANQPYLVPDPGERGRTPRDWGYRPRADLRDDVLAAEEMVRARGMELLVLDQTRPDVAIPVVKVIVPGMRPFWARYAPGRLFDVPVRLGRLTRPTDYGELNPVPLFV
ncbi:TOMM precursor leader peptide-binding protein [Kitasatospora camelliae]|uniref:TOMM leader peptide-binding protein n=1 Tax=Kitasatospora camelliae TaxID=3156397 RepID=A0AAU8K4C5_9ACTN